MRFPKAHTGVKLLFIAQILSLVVVVTQLANAVVAMLPDTGGAIFAAIRTGAVPGLLAAGSAAFPCLVLLIVGLATAKADEPRFGTALMILIVSWVEAFLMAFAMVFFLVSSADFSVSPPSLPPVSPVYFGVSSIVSTVLTTCMMLLIASGIVNLARKLGDAAMITLGRRFQKGIAVICGVSVAISVVSILVRSRSGVAVDWTTALSALASCVFTAVVVPFFGKAKNMLAQ